MRKYQHLFFSAPLCVLCCESAPGQWDVGIVLSCALVGYDWLVTSDAPIYSLQSSWNILPHLAFVNMSPGVGRWPFPVGPVGLWFWDCIFCDDKRIFRDAYIWSSLSGNLERAQSQHIIEETSVFSILPSTSSLCRKTQIVDRLKHERATLAPFCVARKKAWWPSRTFNVPSAKLKSRCIGQICFVCVVFDFTRLFCTYVRLSLYLWKIVENG